MTNKIIYSIIIPHFNLPTLLRRCLASIPQRSDVEVLVVDDASSSDNVQKLERIIKEHDNVSVIYNKKRLGGGGARNIGLKHAKGKYVLFSDSDDFFTWNLNEVLDDYKNTDYDCVFFNATTLDADTLLPPVSLYVPYKYFKKYEYSDEKLEYYLRYIFGQPWCKLVSTQFILENSITFEETIIHNDTQFSYQVGYYAKKIKIDKRSLYCYLTRVNSVSRQKNQDDILKTRLKVFVKKYVFLRNRNIYYKIEPYYIPQVIDYYRRTKNTEQLEYSLKLLKENDISVVKVRFLAFFENFKKSIIYRIFCRLFPNS